jgi:hypothetical protein
MAAGGIALVCASAATAATFKSDSGKLAAAAKSGITASGGSLAFTGTANPTGKTNFAGQIDLTSGQATGLKAPGKLTLSHSGHSATLKVTKISGTTLTGSLNGKSISFPLNLSSATSTPKSHFTQVSVTGVVVKLSSADATALNNALHTSAYKSGTKFGTLSYNGIDRELIETTGGPLTLCDAKAFDIKNTKNGVTPSPVAPATPTAQPCNGPKDDLHGIDFPEPGKILGFIDTTTGKGRITVKGGILDTQSPSMNSAEFKNPIFDIVGPTSGDLRAKVFSNGMPLTGTPTVATVAFASPAVPNITKSGATLTVPADDATVALNSTGAAGLNLAFCGGPSGSSCGTNAYKAGNKIGYAGGTTSFK